MEGGEVGPWCGGRLGVGVVGEVPLRLEEENRSVEE